MSVARQDLPKFWVLESLFIIRHHDPCQLLVRRHHDGKTVLAGDPQERSFGNFSTRLKKDVTKNMKKTSF